MAKEIEFDGAQGTEMVIRKAFAYCSSLWTPSIRHVPGCGHLITRAVIGRVTWDACPKWGRRSILNANASFLLRLLGLCRCARLFSQREVTSPNNFIS